MDKLIKIDDEEINLLAEKLEDNVYLFEGRKLRRFRGHQTENYSYYVVIE